MAARTALITGGAGFIGRETAARLVARGWEVIVLDLLDPQVHGTASPSLADGVRFVHGDVCDAGLVSELVRGTDAVLHLAARTGVGQSMYALSNYVGTNVYGTAILLEALACGDHRVRRLVVASSRAVYGEGAHICSSCGPVAPRFRDRQALNAGRWDVVCPICSAPVRHTATQEDKPLSPGSVYAITKREQEDLCLCVGRTYGIDTIALRYFNVYGAGQPLSNPYTGLIPALAARVLSGEPAEVYEDGKPLRDFVHVNDVAHANVLALEADGIAGLSANIGSGEPISIWDAADTVSRVLGGKHSPQVSGKYRVGDVRHCYADLSLARHALNYTPEVSFADGVRSMADWLRGQYLGDFSAQASRELESRGLLRVGASP